MVAIPVSRDRLRCALLIFLSVSLVFTIIRQVFDLMGYVWSPILMNFLNIIFIIFATFATTQLRSRFFVVYYCWSPFWLAWNSFAICYYLNIGILNRDDSRPLSWGSGGRSWWTGRTPGCQRIYNATSATVQIGDCKFIQPFYVEVIESGVHLLLTLIILVLVVAFLLNFPRKLTGEPYNSLPRRRSSSTNRPHVTVEISPPAPSFNPDELMTDTHTATANAVDVSFGRSSDVSSGYLNVSYDASPAALKVNSMPVPVGKAPSRPPPPQPMQNYRRNSHKRRSSSGGGAGSALRRTREKSRERGTQNEKSRASSADQRSTPRPVVLDDQLPTVPRSRANSASGAADPPKLIDAIRTSAQRQSQRLSRPVQGLGDLLSKSAGPQQIESDTIESNQSSPKQRQPIVRSITKRNGGSNGRVVMDYSMEPRRIGAAASNGDAAQPALDPFRSSNPMRRSVISFDPKSAGDTLLRFHDHLGRSEETIQSRASTSTHHQPPHRTPADLVSFDSGLPASRDAGSDDDPRETIRQPHQKQPIGYEPAFMMSYEPASSQDEPIYRPSFLKSAATGQSPVKFRYDNSGKPFTTVSASSAGLSNGGYAQGPCPNGLNGRAHDRMAMADGVSNESSGSEASSVDGLAVPRISNSSLLV